MTVTVLIYAIIDDYAGTYDGETYDAGDEVHVMFDTGTLALTVDLYDSDGTLKGSPNAGPNLAAFRSYELVTEEPFYRYCDGTTLKYISDTPNAWPYAELLSYPNHFTCVVDAPVCDLQISSVVDIVAASSPSSNDGSLTVSATSSAGSIKFAINDFDYSVGGQSSGLFSSLYPGIYTIYAKDENGCVDSFSVRVPVTNIYGAYYRLEFDDNNNYADHKIDILKRGFSGDVTEICGADVPIRIVHNGSGEGKYSPLIGSSAIVGLMSESNQQFSELFLGDDRQFQVRYYRDGALWWVGYIIPSMYEEPYIAPPYPVFFTATDGIGDLKTFKLLNDVEERYRGDVSYLYIIKEILNKLNLGIDILSGINVFEVDMDQTSADDPLTQAYVNTDVYYDNEPEEEALDCDSVLQALLKPFAARLFQAYGVWWIVRTQEMAAAFDYRFFNSDGTYQGNNTHNPLKDFSSGSDINRAVPRDKAGLLLIIPGYGKITLTQELGLKNNLIKSGEFEEDDLVPTGVGTQMFFRDWSIEQNTEGISYGLEKVNNGDSLGAFYMDFLSASDNDYNLLKSTLFEINASPTDKQKFSFQYLVRPSIQAPWVRFGFKLIATGGVSGPFYYTSNPAFNTSITSPWVLNDTLNEVCADKFGEWVKLEFPMKAVEDATHIEVRFYLQANNRVDYSSIGSLPTIDATIPFGTKRTVGRTISAEDHVSYYTATDTNEPDDSPNLIVSGDGAWVLDKTIRFNQDFSILTSILLDNVVMEYLPDGQNPEEMRELVYVNSEAIKTNYEETLVHGDLGDINNGNNVYKNYIRLSDGTPTELWVTPVSSAKSLLQTLINDYSSQLSIPNYKIQSPIFYDIALTFLVTFEDQFDGGRKYVPNHMDNDIINNTASIEMIELKDLSFFELTELDGGLTDLMEEVDGDLHFTPVELLRSIDGDVEDLMEEVSGDIATFALIDILTNASTDVVITSIDVDGVPVDFVSGDYPNNPGNSGQVSTRKVGTFDVVIGWTSGLSNQKIRLEDSNSNVFCIDVNLDVNPFTCAGVVIGLDTNVEIQASDGLCP